MDIIDDEGNLFGLVNIIDALVVLLLLAVVAAGIALVVGNTNDTPPTDTTYATLDVGTQPTYIVDAINEGDTYAVDSTSSITITDVHVTPRGTQIGVTLRVRITGPAPGGGAIKYTGAPLRLGRSLTIATSRYKISGQIRAVGDSNALSTTEKQVILSGTLPAETATNVAVGDKIRLVGRTVATVSGYTTYTTNNPSRTRIFIEATVAAHRAGGQLRFGGAPLQPGQSVVLPTDTYTFRGQIERVGRGLRADTTVTRTVTLRMADVHRVTAHAIQQGMTEGPADNPVAKITKVETSPALIITTGQNGSVNVVEHPFKRNVMLTATIQVRQTPTGLRFKGQPLRAGSSITLDLGTRIINAQVISIEQ